MAESSYCMSDDVSASNPGNMRRSSNLQSGRTEFRFLIPSKVASVIIGKGGERIQRLRHQCNARLSIPDNQGAERIFAVDGSVENCATIWKDCYQEVKDYMGSRNPESEELDIRLLYHTTLVGNIIGKGGEVIKNLKLTYNLTVLKVYPTPAPRSSDRVVQLVGSIDDIIGCLTEIVEILSKQVPKGDIERFDCSNSDESMALQYGGWGRGGGGNGFGDRRQDSNPRFNRPRDAYSANLGPRHMVPRGGRMSNDDGHMRFGEGPQRWNNTGARPRQDPPFAPRGRGIGTMGGPRKRFNQNEYNDFGGKKTRPNYNSAYMNYNEYDNNSYSQGQSGGYSESQSRVSVPREFIDHINKDNGTKLWNIMKDSGAEINIEPSNSPEGVLSITGNRNEIEGAQYLLQICLKKFTLSIMQ